MNVAVGVWLRSIPGVLYNYEALVDKSLSGNVATGYFVLLAFSIISYTAEVKEGIGLCFER